MTNQLPATPNLRHLHAQAKDLLELCRFGDLVSIDQIRASSSTLNSLNSVQVGSVARLCDAQLAVAHSYGFRNWPALCAAANQMHDLTAKLSDAVKDPRMENFDFRAAIARAKGLPEIGTSRVSEHGVRYVIVDYIPAITVQSAARARAGGLDVHINDLLPVIWFAEMSDRLRELYIETDCVTTRPIIFVDTMPEMHPSTAAPGLNQAVTLNSASPIYIHLDAALVDETTIAHELTHVWIEMVLRIEDFRHPRDQSDLPRISQFYHIQSFVMDLYVNDEVARRGFGMSNIALHQAETICNFAASCARGDKPQNKRVLAGVINAIAGALLEMERFPGAWSTGIRNALDMIQIGLPEAFEPAKGFVRSVLRYGYSDSAAVMRVVDECAKLSFAATGESFDPDKDLIEVPKTKPKWDKRPGFLSCLPLDAKLEVCRETARRGITGRAKYDIVVRYPHYADVVISDPEGEMLEPIRLGFGLPVPPQNQHLMPGAPAPNLPVGSAYIPPVGMPYPGSKSATASRRDQAAAEPIAALNFGPPNHLPSIPDPFAGFPDDFGAMIRPQASSGSRGRMPGSRIPHGRRIEDGFPDPSVDAKRRNEELVRSQAELLYRQRLLQQEMMERHCESYSGTELKPLLTPPGEEYAKLHPRRAIAAPAPPRNYMAGIGRWISRVGFEQQAMGEQPYVYGFNNPVTNVDPSGLFPCMPANDDPCAKYPEEPGFWDNLGSSVSTAAAACPGYNQTQVAAILRCIIESESRDKPHGYKFPTTGSGVQGPCQIWPGPDKDVICGTKWRSSLKEHLLCCAKILCRCLADGGGNLVVGCGTKGAGKNRKGQFQVINQSGSGYSPRFKCCLIRQGIANPSQQIPTAQPLPTK